MARSLAGVGSGGELMAYLRHEFAAGLEEVQLYVAEEFWQQGVKAILQSGDSMDDREDDNLMFLAAKLARYRDGGMTIRVVLLRLDVSLISTSTVRTLRRRDDSLWSCSTRWRGG